MERDELTQKKLKELIHYDPLTGVFTRKIGRSKGTIHSFDSFLASQEGEKSTEQLKENQQTYKQLSINGHVYFCHRLAWLYVYGYFPENDIDHINKNPADNRIENLREVSRMCNLRNAKKSIKNTSGIKGVSFDKRRNLWRAQINVNSVVFSLGSYPTKLEAAKARLNAEQVFNWSSCDSNSSAAQYINEVEKLIINSNKKLENILSAYQK